MRARKPRLTRFTFLRDDQISPGVYQGHRNIKGLLQAAISFLIGIFLAAGGRTRWEHQSLEVAMGFKGSAIILGVILIVGSTVLWCAVLADAPRLRWYGCWICALWHFVMMVFSVWKFATTPATVDDIAFFLWFFLATDYVFSAILSVKWPNRDGDGGQI